MPYSFRLPGAKPSPASHATAKSQLLGEFFPGDACAQDEEDAIERGFITQPWATPFGKETTADINGAICLNSAALISLFLFLAMPCRTRLAQLSMTWFC